MNDIEMPRQFTAVGGNWKERHPNITREKQDGLVKRDCLETYSLLTSCAESWISSAGTKDNVRLLIGTAVS